MRKYALLALSFFGLVLLARPTFGALTLGQQLSGRILLQVQAKGAIWYVYPVNKQRYWLGTTTATDSVIKKVSLAVAQSVLDAIPTHGSGQTGNAAVRSALAGRIIRLGGTVDYWYVSPINKEKYALGASPLSVLKSLGLGISDLNIVKIPIAPGYDAPKVPINGLLRTQKNISTPLGTYLIDVATLDLDRTTLKVMTDTSFTNDCKNGCLTVPLKTYTDRRKAVFGMHGSYFCPPEYASCVGQTGSYFYPVLNSYSRVLVNSSRLKYTNEPLVAFDFTNTPKYYAHAKDLLGSDLFSTPNIATIRALIGNSPMLIVAGKNVANPATMDTKQRTVKSYRGVLGWKGRTLSFIVVRGATVVDSAAVAQALGLDYALNLDGGGSTAMIQNGSYVVGPGRNIPNALLLVP